MQWATGWTTKAEKKTQLRRKKNKRNSTNWKKKTVQLNNLEEKKIIMNFTWTYMPFAYYLGTNN